jgi:hypothetical protein
LDIDNLSATKNNAFMFKQALCNESGQMNSHDSEAKAKKLKIIFWLILLLAGGTFLADVLVRHWQMM